MGWGKEQVEAGSGLTKIAIWEVTKIKPDADGIKDDEYGCEKKKSQTLGRGKLMIRKYACEDQSRKVSKSKHDRARQLSW